MRVPSIQPGGRWAALALFAAAAIASPIRADSIYLNAVGRQNLDALRLRIAPAPIFEDPLRKLPYIRGVIIGERPARDPSARFDAPEGRPEYDVIAFDATGDLRSKTATINATWINHIDADFDSELDVRALFSDRDKLAGVALASRQYFAMARRAADPDGRLGLWRNDVDIPAEPAGVTEGALIRFLMDPPLNDASGTPEKWIQRKQAEAMALIKQSLARRLPASFPPTMDVRPSVIVPKLIDVIAQERAYRLSRSGHERVALGMLVFMLDLTTVTHRDPPAGEHAADAIYLEGLNAVLHALQAIDLATPNNPTHTDTRPMVALHARYLSSHDDTEKAALAAEYNALQEQNAAAGRTACVIHRQFCIDSSQRAAVAIDALMAGEGLFTLSGHGQRLTAALVALNTAPPALNPHKHDRVDLRDPAFTLLVHMIHPTRSPDADFQRRREAAAKRFRQALHAFVTTNEETPAGQEVARRALAAAGWGTPDELPAFVNQLFEQAFIYTGKLVHEPGNKTWLRVFAEMRIACLRSIAELIASEQVHEKAAASAILDRIEKLRSDQKDETKSERSAALFLEIWDESVPPAR